jgi:hypothetical protein
MGVVPRGSRHRGAAPRAALRCSALTASSAPDGEAVIAAVEALHGVAGFGIPGPQYRTARRRLARARSRAMRATMGDACGDAE